MTVEWWIHTLVNGLFLLAAYHLGRRGERQRRAKVDSSNRRVSRCEVCGESLMTELADAAEARKAHEAFTSIHYFRHEVFPLLEELGRQVNP